MLWRLGVAQFRFRTWMTLRFWELLKRWSNVAWIPVNFGLNGLEGAWFAESYVFWNWKYYNPRARQIVEGDTEAGTLQEFSRKGYKGWTHLFNFQESHAVLMPLRYTLLMSSYRLPWCVVDVSEAVHPDHVTAADILSRFQVVCMWQTYTVMLRVFNRLPLRLWCSLMPMVRFIPSITFILC